MTEAIAEAVPTDDIRWPLPRERIPDRAGRWDLVPGKQSKRGREQGVADGHDGRPIGSSFRARAPRRGRLILPKSHLREPQVRLEELLVRQSRAGKRRIRPRELPIVHRAQSIG